MTVDDILRSIVACCNRSSMITLACTCRTFENPALDRLWYQTSLLPLLTTFPRDTWEFRKPSFVCYLVSKVQLFVTSFCDSNTLQILGRDSNVSQTLKIGLDSNPTRAESESSAIPNLNSFLIHSSLQFQTDGLQMVSITRCFSHSLIISWTLLPFPICAA